MTYGAQRIALLRCPLPRGHTELSARTWTSVTPLPVTHLLGYQSGTGRLDTAAPVRPGSPSAGDGHELPRLPSGANFMSRLHPQSWNEAILWATETAGGRSWLHQAVPSLPPSP
jgi:hypothetical protein